MTSPPSFQQPDAIVIGGGLAGKAASIHLSKAGFKVLCIEPGPAGRPSVGESLDWSAPDLLCELGLPMEQLVQSEVATWKRHVTLNQLDGCSEQYLPSAWLGEKPFHVELRTLHVDRFKLDEQLLNLTRAQGVEILCDRVVAIETKGRRVCSVVTAGGERLSARWFLDASGSGTSLLAREFKLPVAFSGPHKVALWSYFPVSSPVEGTTLYMAPTPADYLDWAWEIPIQSNVVSVGQVLTGSRMKEMRAQGLSSEEIFRRLLQRFPRFESLLGPVSLKELNVTSFRCRALAQVAGPNWLLIGEAASMVDPITANGVTAALRHAAEANAMIRQYRDRRSLPWGARVCYSKRSHLMARFFNGGIENIVYEPAVRNRVGLARAGEIYTGPAWSMNAVYARLRPKGFFSTFVLGMVLQAFRGAAWSFQQFCRMAPAEASN